MSTDADTPRYGGLEVGDLVLRRSHPAEFMRFKAINHDKHRLTFETGENEFGAINYVCPIEHADDMFAAGFWEIIDSRVVE